MNTGTEAALQDILDRWKAGIDAHRPQQIAGLFTEDAIFQGLCPYSVGRSAIAAYYDSQPPGLAAHHRIVETRILADDLILGYLAVDFTFTDRPTLHVWLSVLVKRTEDGWQITHYQVSHLD